MFGVVSPESRRTQALVTTLPAKWCWGSEVSRIRQLTASNRAGRQEQELTGNAAADTGESS